jgi:hypothetical protein
MFLFLRGFLKMSNRLKSLSKRMKEFDLSDIEKPLRGLDFGITSICFDSEIELTIEKIDAEDSIVLYQICLIDNNQMIFDIVLVGEVYWLMESFFRRKWYSDLCFCEEESIKKNNKKSFNNFELFYEDLVEILQSYSLKKEA